MSKFSLKNLISMLILAVLCLTAIFGVSFFSGNSIDNLALSEEEFADGMFLDAGEYTFFDDFRFNGFNKGETPSKSIENHNLYTSEYGNCLNGLVAMNNVLDNVGDTGSGYLTYKVPLSYVGVFVNLKYLELSLSFKMLDGQHEKSIGIYYAFDGETYLPFIEQIEVLEKGDFIQNKSVDLSSLVSEAVNPDIINYEYIYVRIALNYQELQGVNLSDIELNLYTIKFVAFQKFSSGLGASARAQNDSSYGDLRYKTYVSKDLLVELNEKYPANQYNINFYSLILPYDYIETCGEFSLNNLTFSETGVYIGSGDQASSIIYWRSNLLIDKKTNNRVEIKNINGDTYFVFFGAISRIKDSNLDREFVQKGLIDIKNKENFSSIRVLADYKNGDVKNNSRSVCYVAQKAMQDQPSLTSILSKNFTNKLVERIEGDIGTYTLRKIYVDSSYNILNIEDTLFSDVKIGDQIILSNDKTASNMQGFSLISNDSPIELSGEILYQNIDTGLCLASNRTVLSLYYSK